MHITSFYYIRTLLWYHHYFLVILLKTITIFYWSKVKPFRYVLLHISRICSIIATYRIIDHQQWPWKHVLASEYYIHSYMLCFLKVKEKPEMYVSFIKLDQLTTCYLHFDMNIITFNQQTNRGRIIMMNLNDTPI